MYENYNIVYLSKCIYFLYRLR